MPSRRQRSPIIWFTARSSVAAITRPNPCSSPGAYGRCRTSSASADIDMAAFGSTTTTVAPNRRRARTRRMPTVPAPTTKHRLPCKSMNSGTAMAPRRYRPETKGAARPPPLQARGAYGPPPVGESPPARPTLGQAPRRHSLPAPRCPAIRMSKRCRAGHGRNSKSIRVQEARDAPRFPRTRRRAPPRHRNLYRPTCPHTCRCARVRAAHSPMQDMQAERHAARHAPPERPRYLHVAAPLHRESLRRACSPLPKKATDGQAESHRTGTRASRPPGAARRRQLRPQDATLPRTRRERPQTTALRAPRRQQGCAPRSRRASHGPWHSYMPRERQVRLPCNLNKMPAQAPLREVRRNACAPRDATPRSLRPEDLVCHVARASPPIQSVSAVATIVARRPLREYAYSRRVINGLSGKTRARPPRIYIFWKRKA